MGFFIFPFLGHEDERGMLFSLSYLLGQTMKKKVEKRFIFNFEAKMHAIVKMKKAFLLMHFNLYS